MYSYTFVARPGIAEGQLTTLPQPKIIFLIKIDLKKDNVHCNVTMFLVFTHDSNIHQDLQQLLQSLTEICL